MSAKGVAAVFALCVYSGFFGAGFGTFLIFALMHFFGLSFVQSASVNEPTVIRQLAGGRMFPMTLEGLTRAMRQLTK